ncbi:LuxR family two component transcriptional regulator [Marinoscillum furvescens DSM 4134]|uniref:LuxR family two component transcriptional regulator n=2 Tax=Marinoscillum furvescens TaxID=1026 RepID=A0A3D9L0L8_MARFU|nr:LuxR family two component transcriptional regulator [Marinoscillum furvescens DSM 4134]
MAAKTIMLVDDHKIIRDGLKLYFEDSEEYDVAAEAENGKQALEILESKDFDLVITDISMPEMDGITFTQNLRQAKPEQKIMALTMMGENQHIKHMLSAGVNGYILKNSNRSEIFKAIETILNGENYYSGEVTKIIMDSMSGKKKPTQRLTLETPLTNREKEVLKLIVKEHSNQEIADALFISVRTVDAHKRNLLEKTGCKNIAGLVVYALEHDIT